MKREETVDYNIKVAWHAISRMYNQQGAPVDISSSTGFVLLNIHTEEGTAATKIAPLMGLESRSLTRLLKTLEEKGYVYREPDPQDRRSVRIFLTPLGKEKREISRQTVLQFNNYVRDHIAPDQLKVFLEVMRTICSLIEEKKIFSEMQLENAGSSS